MKKIVGILGMAAMLGSAAFAAEPAANFVMADFTGNASFGWKSDFANEKHGFENADEASLKFGFVNGGDKTTTGDGVWGELKIAADSTAVTQGKIKVGNVKDDGWKSLQDNNITYDEDADGNKTDAYLNLPNLFPTASVKIAKINFLSGDFYGALSLLKPSLNYDAFAPAAATGIGYKAGGLEADKKDATFTNGFALNLGLTDILDFNFKLKNKGVVKNNKWGLAFDVTTTPVENLKVFAAGSFNLESEYYGFGATADYKFAIADSMYLKPGVGFDYSKKGKAKDAKNLAAGLLFGWGAENVKPELPFVNTDSDKFNEGVSVTVFTNLEDKGLALNVGLYDQSLLSLLGDEFGTLKTGVSFTYAQSFKVDDVYFDYAKSDLAIGTKYDVKLSPIYVSVKGGMKTSFLDVKNYEAQIDYSLGLQVGSAEVIDNTDVYVKYDMAGNSKASKLTKNELSVGTKISF